MCEIRDFALGFEVVVVLLIVIVPSGAVAHQGKRDDLAGIDGITSGVGACRDVSPWMDSKQRELIQLLAQIGKWQGVKRGKVSRQTRSLETLPSA
ncbi:MAG TPA: hypothetical protein VJ862_03455 [Rhodanobacteraceae bacterium]|nr:hypothetical protein [Rhodanobacteraceae bacterium]